VRLKLRWRRSDSFIDFAISDYFAEAPEEIVNMLAETIFTRIYDGNIDYPEGFCDWLTGPEFIALNRDRFLGRCKVLPAYREKHHSLQRAYEDLLDKRLIDEIPGLVLRWTDAEDAQPKGRSSALMRAVVMPTYMDTDTISDEAFEFNLFRLLLTVVSRFGEDPMINKMEIDRRISEYPESGRLAFEIENNIPVNVCGGF